MAEQQKQYSLKTYHTPVCAKVMKERSIPNEGKHWKASHYEPL